MMKGHGMLYICEFEFYGGDDGYVIADCLNEWGGGTFGDDFDDAVECAADWLRMMVEDCLMNDKPFPPMKAGHKPQHGGQVIAVAVVRELSDIKAVTAADAARMLGVSRARVTQLAKSGMLDSWIDGTKRMVSLDSVNARLEYADYREKPKAETLKMAATI